MSARGNIKWRDSDVKAISAAVRSFNAKLTRLARRNPEIIPALPQRRNAKELRDQITTRAEFNRELAALRRFTQRGAEKLVTNPQGVLTTQWELNDVRRRVRIINNRRARELAAANPSIEKGNLSSIEQFNLAPKKLNFATITPGSWEKFVESVEKQSQASYSAEKQAQYKKNYLQAILDNLGPGAKALYDYVSSIPAETLFTNSMGDPILSIDFIYDPLQAEVIIDSTFAHWHNVLGD